MRKIDVPREHFERTYVCNPVTVISTVDSAGFVNAAPFNMCMRVCFTPLMLGFSVVIGKDTHRNVLDTKEFVVNIPPEDPVIIEKMLIMGIRFPPRVNELEKAGLTAIPSKEVKPPRIAEFKAHYECKLEFAKEIENFHLFVGKVVAVSMDEDVLTEDYRVIIERLKPLHYMGRQYVTFTGTGKVYRMVEKQAELTRMFRW